MAILVVAVEFSWRTALKRRTGSDPIVTPSQPYAAHLLSLEPRLMFDAAAAATAADSFADAVAAADASEAWEHLAPDAHDPADGADSHDTPAEYEPASQSMSGEGGAFIFIDSSVEAYQTLASMWAGRGTVVIIDANKDGIDQIRTALAGQTDIESIHIVSHGQSGGFGLGTSWIDGNTAQGDLSSSLAAIGAKLSPDGDILLYGCDIAADEAGKSFLNVLAQVTGADIAASDDDTGAAALGGNWTLEATSGVVQTMALDGAQWSGSLAQIVINPLGGVLANGSDGLRIHVMTNGQVQVLYQGSNQLYDPATSLEGYFLFNGMYMSVGNDLGGPHTQVSNYYLGLTTPWIATSQILTGTGSAANPYVVTTTMMQNHGLSSAIYEPNYDFLDTVSTTYVVGTRYFTNTVTVTPPSGNTQNVRWFHLVDTFLGGSDQGPAYALAPGIGSTTNPANDISVIATRRGFGTPSEVFVGFAEVDGGRQFDRYFSGFFGLPYEQIAQSGQITNTIDTTATIDNGLGIQFNLGTLTQATSFSYRMVFDGDTSIDLDANNSTAPGLNYVTEYGIGTGNSIAVVDTDVQIENIVADISRATITINGAQTGDTLAVAGALPPGIIASVSGNTLTLTGSATEAAYQQALKQVRFSTSSMVLTSRSLTVSVYNEVSSTPATANTTINMGRPPVVDLNSGVTPQQRIENGDFDTAISASDWTATGGFRNILLNPVWV